MVHKNQVINGVMAFMDNNMIPKAEGNYKIILRTVRSGLSAIPENVWDFVKKNSLIAMTGAVDGDHVDIDLLAHILSEGFGNDEFNLGFSFLGKEYNIYLASEDIRALKSYIERA